MSSKPGVRSEAADRTIRLQAEGLSRTGPPHPVSGLATAVLVGALGFWSQAGAAEFHFVVQDLGEKRALWVPRKWGVIVPRGCKDGLLFVLENPTDRTHAFAAYGLFEEITGAHGDIARSCSA